MDETAARDAFERALQTHAPGFGTYFLARLLDLDITYPEGKCVVRMPVRDFQFNPIGCLHGGMIATVMDISMGHLLRHSYGVGGATLEMKVQYLRAITGGTVRAEAQFLRRGRRLAFVESRLYDEADRLAVVATSTWKMPEATRKD
ncbi:MAG: PaaI family thioesterase [Amaricoccus sp.]|uniref:PaaI family thioesterase n=1 Tax=Amaricoccus sp. TaxID=1872485 RepID=UPI0039E6308F